MGTMLVGGSNRVVGQLPQANPPGRPEEETRCAGGRGAGAHTGMSSNMGTMLVRG